MTHTYRFLSLNIWGTLPARVQRFISGFYAKIYNHPFTKYIIKPYCKFNYQDEGYLDQFRSPSGSNKYSSFQDFFTRKYKRLPDFNSDMVWPCEGLLCDSGKVSDLPDINVKGDIKSVSSIFGKFGHLIKNNNHFSNVFLHNNNYHRIHSPVSGTVIDIEWIKGELILLRPWIYKNDPSLPAMRNERVNLHLRDENNNDWLISIVGGPAVGTIKLKINVLKKESVQIGQELGMFMLGSTCCMISPTPTRCNVGTQVSMGDGY